jgi:hypothetical protein
MLREPVGVAPALGDTVLVALALSVPAGFVIDGVSVPAADALWAIDADGVLVTLPVVVMVSDSGPDRDGVDDAVPVKDAGADCVPDMRLDDVAVALTDVLPVGDGVELTDCVSEEEPLGVGVPAVDTVAADVVCKRRNRIPMGSKSTRSADGNTRAAFNNNNRAHRRTENIARIYHSSTDCRWNSPRGGVNPL